MNSIRRYAQDGLIFEVDIDKMPGIKTAAVHIKVINIDGEHLLQDPEARMAVRYDSK